MESITESIMESTILQAGGFPAHPPCPWEESRLSQGPAWGPCAWQGGQRGWGQFGMFPQPQAPVWSPIHRSPSQEEGDVDERREVCEELEGEDLHSEVVLPLGEGPWLLWRRERDPGRGAVGPCPAPPPVPHSSLQVGRVSLPPRSPPCPPAQPPAALTQVTQIQSHAPVDLQETGTRTGGWWQSREKTPAGHPVPPPTLVMMTMVR